MRKNFLSKVLLLALATATATTTFSTTNHSVFAEDENSKVITKYESEDGALIHSVDGVGKIKPIIHQYWFYVRTEKRGSEIVYIYNNELNLEEDEEREQTPGMFTWYKDINTDERILPVRGGAWKAVDKLGVYMVYVKTVEEQGEQGLNIIHYYREVEPTETAEEDNNSEVDNTEKEDDSKVNEKEKETVDTEKEKVEEKANVSKEKEEKKEMKNVVKNEKNTMPKTSISSTSLITLLTSALGLATFRKRK